jgi:hypothetical protein
MSITGNAVINGGEYSGGTIYDAEKSIVLTKQFAAGGALARGAILRANLSVASEADDAAFVLAEDLPQSQSVRAGLVVAHGIVFKNDLADQSAEMAAALAARHIFAI